MKRNSVNLVWLKRDLRTQDHEPLLEAEMADEDYLIVYFIEPSALKHPDYSLRHLQFCYHSIIDMNAALKPYNREVHILSLIHI